MIQRRLTSLQHPLVKRLVKLRKDKKFRITENSVLVSGETLIQELASHWYPKTLISSSPICLSGDNLWIAPSEIMQKIVGYPTNDLVVAEFPLPSLHFPDKYHKILILDTVLDPGNVGTIMRTALAFSWDGIFCISPCVDPFNDKVLRSSRAAPFFIPIQQGSWKDLVSLLEKRNVELYVADLKGKSFEEIDFKYPLALVLGHETRGVSINAQKRGTSITISMSQKMESLNVAAAAAILIHHLKGKSCE